MKHFEQWMMDVEKRLSNKWGVSSDTIPDMPWYDWFLDEAEVNDACEWAIELVKSGAAF